jgi:hypothetical protein
MLSLRAWRRIERSGISTAVWWRNPTAPALTPSPSSATSSPANRPHIEKILENMVNAKCATHVGCASVPELRAKSSCFLSFRSAVAACSLQYPGAALPSERGADVRVDLVARATGRTLVGIFAMSVARSGAPTLEVTMNSPATPRSSGRSRLVLMAAGVLVLLGSFVVPAPAQAGYYESSYPCSYRCGYRYAPYRYYNRCSACGCVRRCHSGLLYERRYVEREYVERRYGRPCCHHRRHYGYNPYGYGGYRSPYYGGYRSSYGDDRPSYGGYRPWPRPLGYGGVRGWGAPYGYQPSAERYEETPRPPAPVWDGAGYEDGDWQ